jgi:uncharacterized metal-binding protein
VVADGVGGIGSSLLTRRGGCASAGVPRLIDIRRQTRCVPKEAIGIKPEEKVSGPGKWETMCNPIAQAMIINNAQVNLAIMLGLCIGHDTLFIKYCDVPLTVLAVKDRLLAHNPLAALYLSDSYYQRLRNGIR